MSTFVGDRYQKQIYRGEEVIRSMVFPELRLTSGQVLQAGRVAD